ncbi:MAG: dihydrodipicolinate synthase/N-acetylneuraminate lyase [Paenibacillus sp.]|jgi:N-acetylneuraminate lyase|nr:dihydrodipicolinate synthase/N-acetylneuraminate lyase [Paenibacillus sp.]
MAQLHQQPFSGVHVAMNSCYDDTGEVSPKAAKRLTRFLIEKGVNGLYVGGGTGEGILQTAEERMSILEAVLEENAGQVTVTAHIGANITKDSVRLAQHAEQAGADAVSSIPPFYYTYSEDAVKAYWDAMMDNCELPFIIYNIPAATGFNMSTAMLKDMLTRSKLLGIKMTTFSVYDIQQFKAIGGDKFKVFNGPDQQYLAGRLMGADAGIGGTYCAMPELFVRLERHIQNGQMKEAQDLQVVINEIITDIRAIGLFAALKELVRLRGVDCGQPRLPLPAAKTSDGPTIRAIYDKIMKAVEQGERVQH